MEDVLVEIYFEGNSNFTKNILIKKELEILQMVCSRPIQYQQLSKRHIDLEETYFWKDEDKNHEDAKILVDKYYIGENNNIVPLNRLLSLPLNNLTYKIKNKIKEIPEYDIEENLINKLIKFEERLNLFDRLTEFNFKVGVHISDLGLLNIKQVTWLQNFCTEDLQGYLDDGWRILAVCPQSNSRRPDYILGRNDKVD